MIRSKIQRAVVYFLVLAMTALVSCDSSDSDSSDGGGGNGNGGNNNPCDPMGSVIGTWEGFYKGCRIVMRFNQNGFAYLFDGDETVVGQYELVDGIEIVVTINLDNGQPNCKESIDQGMFNGVDNTGEEWRFDVCGGQGTMRVDYELDLTQISALTPITGVWQWDAPQQQCTDTVQFTLENNLLVQSNDELKNGIFLLEETGGSSYSLYRYILNDNIGQSCPELVQNQEAENNTNDESTVIVNINEGNLTLDGRTYQLVE